jgi:hypothetical protein
MIAKSDVPQSSLTTRFVVAALAAIITAGILTGVTELILLGCLPFERLVMAERACSHHDYVSERDACMREWAVLQRTVSLAGK